MPNWKHTIDISEAYAKEDPRAVVAAIKEKLLALPPIEKNADYRKEGIIEECDMCLSSDEVYDEDANDVLEMLYDWGDYGHTCFVKTWEG